MNDRSIDSEANVTNQSGQDREGEKRKECVIIFASTFTLIDLSKFLVLSKSFRFKCISEKIKGLK